MSWAALLAACAACLGLKLLGYLAPHSWLENPRVSRLATMVTIGLLAALVGVQTVGHGSGLALDARAAALGVAAVALWRRVPFIGVVLLAGGTAAALRALGLP